MHVVAAASGSKDLWCCVALATNPLAPGAPPAREKDARQRRAVGGTVQPPPVRLQEITTGGELLIATLLLWLFPFRVLRHGHGRPGFFPLPPPFRRSNPPAHAFFLTSGSGWIPSQL
jgi:hypothetical protein